MDIILFETVSSSAADDLVAAVQAQSVWGVNMGTTSKAASYSNYVAVEATATRVASLLDNLPDDVDFHLHIRDIYSFTDAPSDQKLWYLRGKL